MRQRFIASILVSLVSLSSLAAAQPATAPDAESRSAAYKDGQRAIAAKDWSLAETILQRLWTENQTYDVAASLGQAEYNLKKYKKAAEHFAFSIQHFPPKEKVEKLEQTKRFLTEATKRIGTLHITVDRPSAEVRIDDELVGTSPLSANTYVDAGTRVIDARIADHAPTRQEITIVAGGELSVELKIADPVLPSGSAPSQPHPASGLEAEDHAAPAVNATPSDSPSKGIQARTVALWGGVGVTAVALGVGVGFAVKSASANDDADSARSKLQPGDCASPAAPACSELKQALDDHNSASKAANISFAVAGIAGLATAAMFVLWPSRHTERAGEVRLAPIATHNSGGLIVSGKF